MAPGLPLLALGSLRACIWWFEFLMDNPKLLMSVQSNILYFQDSQPAIHPGLLRTEHSNLGSVNAFNQYQK